MRAAALSLLIACVLAAPAAAQPVNLDALAARMARDAELADQNRRSEALNAELNRRNAEIQARNEAARAAYARAEADYQAAVAAREAQIAAQAAEAEKAQADYRRAMDAWTQRVAACKAGDYSQCEPRPAPTR